MFPPAHVTLSRQIPWHDRATTRAARAGLSSDSSSPAGKDATEAFEDVGHSDEARAMLTKMYLGDFKGEVGCAAPPALLAGPLDRFRAGCRLQRLMPEIDKGEKGRRGQGELIIDHFIRVRCVASA